MIKRILEERIQSRLNGGKAIILMGPRQTGKTTLLSAIFGNTPGVLWLNGDDPEVRLLLEDVTMLKWTGLPCTRITVYSSRQLL